MRLQRNIEAEKAGGDEAIRVSVEGRPCARAGRALQNEGKKVVVGEDREVLCSLKDWGGYR